jgi:ubiquinone/menaquinone biosynthesis C-methylase UbiE
VKWYAIIALAGCAAPVTAQAPFLMSQAKPPVNRLAPGVPSPQNVVEKMLEEVGVKPNEMVYDLGSGDGRVVITAAQKFGARAVGVEISAKEVKASRERIEDAKLERRVRILEGDLLEVDLSEADVVTMYLLTSSNDLIRPNLEKYLKPGARVVSHDYPVRGWQPNRVVQVDSYRRMHHLYIYEMPPKRD